MAWITKNSATAQIERRDEPYLDDTLKTRLEDEVIGRYPRRQAATLPVLHAIQEKYGYIPYQAIEETGDLLGVSASEVLDTATFYEEFFLEPKGRYTIWICQSISCEILGEPSLTEQVGKHLGIQPGQTTPDGKYTLMKVECLGACGGAPCALINETLHENIGAGNLEQVLDSLE